MHKILRRVYDLKVFVGLCFIEVRRWGLYCPYPCFMHICMVVRLIYIEYEVWFGIVMVIWSLFLFLAYQVGLHVVTLRPVPDRTNWQVDSLWRILSTAYLWLGSVDLWIFKVSVKRFYKYSGYFILSSQPDNAGTATKNMHILCWSSVTETVQWKYRVVDWKIHHKEASPGLPFLWLPQL